MFKKLKEEIKRLDASLTGEMHRSHALEGTVGRLEENVKYLRDSHDLHLNRIATLEKSVKKLTAGTRKKRGPYKKKAEAVTATRKARTKAPALKVIKKGK